MTIIYTTDNVCDDIEINPCPMVKTCQCKTAMCNVRLPDESCYWYRYFKNRIKEVEDEDVGHLC